MYKPIVPVCLLVLACAAGCGEDTDEKPPAAAGANSSGGRAGGDPTSGKGGTDSGEGGDSSTAGGSDSGEGGSSSPAGGAGGQASANPQGGAPGQNEDPLEGCMTPTPGLVDYCEDQPKTNAIYCPAPSEMPFAECDLSPGSPLNFDGYCCDTAVCVRSTSSDAICGVLSPGKTIAYTCHADAEAPSADCDRTDDGACCPP